MLKEALNLKIVKWLIFASFFAPLIVVDFFFFPFIVPKTLFFQVVIEVALFFYVALILSNRSYLPKFDLIAKSVLVFFGVYVLAAVFGENVFRSFFGVFERMLGVFNLAHFVALFFITRSVFRRKNDWLQLFRVFLFAGVIVGLYGLAQKFGFYFVYNAGTNRIDATIGNAAFFAAYTMFNMFFAMFMLVFDKRKDYFNYFYKFALVVGASGIYLSETRGAMLGAFVAFLFLGASLLLHNKERIGSVKILSFKESIYLRWLTAFVAVVVLLFIFNKDIILDPLKRIGSISFQDTTTQTRILAAGVSWQGFLEYPVLGWGPENYNLVFDKHYDPRLYPAEQWFDHAHNIIFDNLINAGALGLLSYLALLGVTIYLLFIYGKKDDESFTLSRIFIALVMAYFLQNIFVFDALATYLPFFVLLAFVGYLATSKGGETAESSARVDVGPVPVVLVFVVLASSIYFLNIRPAMSSYYLTKALMTPLNYYDDALASFDKAHDLALMGRPEIATKVVDQTLKMYKAEGAPQEAKDKFMAKAIERSREAIAEEPKNVRYYEYFTNLAFVDLDNKELISELDGVMDKAVALAPNKPVVHLQRYQLKAILGKNEEAVAELQKAVDLYYEKKIALVLAQSYRKIDKTDESIALYKEIFKKSHKDLELKEAVFIAVDLASMGDNESAIDIAGKIVKDHPEFEEDSKTFIDEIKAGRFLDGHFQMEE